MKKRFKLICLLGGNPVRTMTWRMEARDFVSAIAIFNTSSQFDGYDLLSIELEEQPRSR